MRLLFNFQAGALNSIRGNFEIVKNDVNKDRQVDVLVPEEFEDEAFIRVQIISNGSLFFKIFNHILFYLHLFI